MQAEVMPADFDGASLEETQMRMAILELLQGASMAQAAANLGISERTLYRWKTLPQWREATATVQAEVIGGARLRLIGMVHKALTKLDALVDDSSGKGAPTEASIAWGILDRVGVEVQAAQAEGVRRILTRVPREVAAPAQAATVVPEPLQPATAGDRPAHRIITRH